MSPDVTICIPAWQAEPFIARTLDCARAQTHGAVRILVSIDRCEDRTEAICRQAAAGDSRIEVIVQRERLGWAENANALLRKVDTPYYFLYFHDDIIDPCYVEALLDLLARHPRAASAHCDLEKFGDQRELETGGLYDGTDSRRLMLYLTEEVKGPLLRALIRSNALSAGPHFPPMPGNGNWRVPPFILQLLAAGTSVYLPQALYRRWMREGTLTRTWHPASAEELITGQRESTRISMDIINRLDATPPEKTLVLYCLYLRMMIRTRSAELRLNRLSLIDAADIAPAFRSIRAPGSLGDLEPDMLKRIKHTHAQLLLLEGRHALQHDQIEEAVSKFDMSLSLDPASARARKALTKLLRQSAGEAKAATIAARHAIRIPRRTEGDAVRRMRSGQHGG